MNTPRNPERAEGQATERAERAPARTTARLPFGGVPERLSRNRFEPDESQSHIEVDQDAVKATGAGPLLERVCAAHVYSLQPDGSVGVTYQACLECGTCLAVAPPGTLRWHYPAGGAGVAYREG